MTNYQFSKRAKQLGMTCEEYAEFRMVARKRLDKRLKKK